MSCSFCGGPQQPQGFIAGAHGYICAGCVRLAEGVLSSGRPAATPIARLETIPATQASVECSFCGKRRNQVGAIAEAGRARICDECLDLCGEILSEIP
jgi:ATP-dependent protease Clp ATPase subunit